MIRPAAVLFVMTWFAGSLAAAPAPKQNDGVFLVHDRGLTLLRPDGEVQERVHPYGGLGALSPGGRWIAFFESTPEACVLIRSRSGRDVAARVPGTYARAIWAPDGDRVLLLEGADTFHLFQVSTKKLVPLDLPSGSSVCDWSQDGKRLLAVTNESKLAWVSFDPKTETELLTVDGGVGVFAGVLPLKARLSPDGRRLLCMARPVDKSLRLCSIDLSTGKCSVLDEPGLTYGFCWSPDGSRVAYTWQRPVEDKTRQFRERVLFTCDPEGRDRKMVTSRRYEPPGGGPIRTHFFVVLDWR